MCGDAGCTINLLIVIFPSPNAICCPYDPRLHVSPTRHSSVHHPTPCVLPPFIYHNSPTTSCPVSPSALQSRSLSQPGNPPSPALQCPICLDTFSAIRSRGESCLYFILHFSHRSFYQGSSWSAQSVATSSVGDVSSNVSSLLTQQQCPTCRRRIAHQDFHPLLL